MAADSFSIDDVDLTNCDREPIHQLGHVQPFSHLMAFTTDWLLSRASANVEPLFGAPVDDLIGRPLSEIMGDEAAHHLRNMLAAAAGENSVERSFDRKLLKNGLATGEAASRSYDCAIHHSGAFIIVEFEKSLPAVVGDPASLVRSMMTKLDAAPSVDKFLDRGGRMVRQVTGFDRVMVYRFEEDGHGEVVAESLVPGIDSFLGLHYPASDIPRQARALYVRNAFRVIADTSAGPAPVLPQREERKAPLDLSLSIGRAVSPIHIEYLTNMGVKASLSISIIVNGELWGLFACHHYSPRIPSFRERTLAELFSQMFSLKLESRLRAQLIEHEHNARAAGDVLMAAIASDSQRLGDAEFLAEAFEKMVEFDGLAVLVEGRLSKFGITPPDEDIRQLARQLNARATCDVIAENCLGEMLSSASDYADKAAGMLAISVSRKPRDYVLLFRKELAQTINWAGNPEKPVELGPHGPRLTPRASFDAFREEVRGCCRPFTVTEQHLARTLRQTLIEVVLRVTDAAREDSRRHTERQELLIAELNHRVRNILALIRGIVRQSKGAADTAEAYIDLLQGRIAAMARAHDQITQDNWSSASLRRLIQTEAEAYLNEKAGRVSIEGEDALLDPTAFSTMALVIHELTTNSAKYGALSDSGRVCVRLSRNDAGDLAICWQESGGPAVRKPSRRGFGTTILERTLPHDLGGEARLDFKLSGLQAHFEIPARFVQFAAQGRESDLSPPPKTEHPRIENTGSDVPGHVLVVEDNLIVAMDCEEMLTKAGVEKVELAASSDQALAYLEQERPDYALLDFNLGAVSSTPIAERLMEMGVPFCFATGYGDQIDLPDHLAGMPVLQKPFEATQLHARLVEGTSSSD